MHETGGYVDVSTLLPLIITVVIITISFGAFLNLIKTTASKYFNPSLKFDIDESRALKIQEEQAELTPMLERHNVCAVCGEPGTKRCSRCKSTRYCSLECQTKHWNQGHKQDCRAAKAPAEGAIKNGYNFSNAFGTYKKNTGLSKASSPGVPLALSNENSDGILPKHKKVLFPYETFVELFNWNKHRMTPCGLVNCGNSCFANVVLQCLTYTRPLVAYMLEGSHMLTCVRNDWCFLCELCQHIRRVKQSEKPFSPLGILSHIPKMGGNLGCGKQEDAHEFMRFAIDSMQSVFLDEFGGENAVDPDSKETTLIYHTFGGRLQSQVMCAQCLRISNRYDNMLDLNVEIQGDVASLEDALEQFTAPEWLDGENKYKCDGCDAYVRAHKRLTVHQAPNILTIALKRFQTGRFGKLNKRVTFPETLDLFPYISGEEKNLHIYKLYAVVVHVDMLNASFFGHYICYVKDLHGSWYRLDDCKVNTVELEEVLSQRAYMLLYSRISVRPSPVADIPKSTAIKSAKEDFNYSASIVHSQSHFTSRTDGYLSSPFEVVEPLKSNLGNVQEAMNDNTGVLDSLTSTDGLGTIQSLDSVLGSLNSCNADLLPVDLTSEESGLLTGNSSCSEESSMRNGKKSLDKVLTSLPELKEPGTSLQRTTSCPLFVDAKTIDAPSRSSIVGNMKHNVYADQLNETSTSVDPLAGLTFLPLETIYNEKLVSCVSKQSDDTPRTSGLTEDEASRILAIQNSDLDVQGPEKMDCDDEVEQCSPENSSDSFIALLESAMEEITDSSVQQVPISWNETLFQNHTGMALPNLSLDVLPSTVGGNQNITPLDYGDFCGLPVRSSNAFEVDWMEDKMDAGHELLLQEEVSTEQTTKNDSHLSVSYATTKSPDREMVVFNKEQEIIPLVVSHSISTQAKDNVVSCELVSEEDRFANENGMAERIEVSHKYNHTMECNETCQTNQNIFLENPQASMLEGSGSSPEFLTIPLAGAKVVASCGNGGPIMSTPVKKTVKSKPMFAPGFLKRPQSSNSQTHSNSLQDNGNHSVLLSGTRSSPRDSSNDVSAKLMNSNSSHFDVDLRANLNVSSNESSSTPGDELQITSSVCSEFDTDTKGEVQASQPCEAYETERRNNMKTKPLFPPGFLNKTSKSQTVTQTKPSHMVCSENGFAAVHNVARGDGTCGDGQFNTNSCQSMLSQSGKQVNPVVVAAEQNENIDYNLSGSSTSNEHEILGSGRKKRALSSESLHTEQGSPVTMNAKGKASVTMQKQGRNDSCSCGSQRKWKKCCGRPDALRPIAGM